MIMICSRKIRRKADFFGLHEYVHIFVSLRLCSCAWAGVARPVILLSLFVFRFFKKKIHVFYFIIPFFSSFILIYELKIFTRATWACQSRTPSKGRNFNDFGNFLLRE